MRVLESNIVGKSLYDMVTSKKLKFEEYENMVLTPTAYAFTETKFGKAVVIGTTLGAFYSSDKPVVDSFETIVTTIGVKTNIRAVSHISDTTGRKYFTIEPVFEGGVDNED